MSSELAWDKRWLVYEIRKTSFAFGSSTLPVLQLEGVDEPHGQVEEDQEVAHVAAWHVQVAGALGGQILR